MKILVETLKSKMETKCVTCSILVSVGSEEDEDEDKNEETYFLAIYRGGSRLQGDSSRV